MDFWAAMEHRVSYKKQYDNKEQRVAELLQYSNILEKMEKECRPGQEEFYILSQAVIP